MHSEEIRRRKPLVFKVSAMKCTWPSTFWWTTSWNLIKICFPLPERTMRLIILTPHALYDVYTISAGQDFFASCLSLKKNQHSSGLPILSCSKQQKTRGVRMGRSQYKHRDAWPIRHAKCIWFSALWTLMCSIKHASSQCARSTWLSWTLQWHEWGLLIFLKVISLDNMEF